MLLFSMYCFKGHKMLKCSISGDGNFDHFVKLVSASFQYHKITIFFCEISQYFLGHYTGLRPLFCSLNLCSSALAFIDTSWPDKTATVVVSIYFYHCTQLAVYCKSFSSVQFILMFSLLIARENIHLPEIENLPIRTLGTHAHNPVMIFEPRGLRFDPQWARWDTTPDTLFLAAALS